MPARLAVVDSDARYAEWLKLHLAVLCPESNVRVVKPGELSPSFQEVSARECEVLVLGTAFGSGPEDPQAPGLELLRTLREQPHCPAIVVIAEEGNELTAVKALQLGAFDYLPKRLVTPERLKSSIKLTLRLIEKRVARQIANLSPQSAAQPGADDRSAESAAHGVETPPATGHTDGSTEAPTAAADQPAATPADQESAVLQAGTPDARRADDILAAGSPAAQPAQSAQPAQVSPARAPGGEFMSADFIPGYVIHATIGESEKAAVYVATSAARRENVALKVSKTLRDEAAGRQFLEREYRAITAIRHRSVVQIFDYGIHSGYEYLVMEYLPRGDLKSRMQQGLTEQDALTYVAQVAAALQIVHTAGLIHRDLKPPNVMLRDNGDVALIDFGLARALDGSTAHSTRTGVLRGSPYYMSPEQALGEILDTRSDFYSLGIMYFEMLTGRKPYQGGSAMDVLQQHVNAPLPMLPNRLIRHEPLLLKLLAKSRDDRYATAQAILADIQKLLLEGDPHLVPHIDTEVLGVESTAA